MSAIDESLSRLRSRSVGAGGVAESLGHQGVGFAAVGGTLHERWRQAVDELDHSIRPIAGRTAVLNEGGGYLGSWLESTGTISSTVLSRFVPDAAEQTHLQFARLQRDDGMLPYKVTQDGAGFSQIQIVSPLARSVWSHYLLCGRDGGYLRTMYDAMARYDGWLTRYRDTRGTGGVEAFCTFDTGHDLSPRFWHVPDRGFRGDARRYDPDSSVLPYIAPDLTANVACQRSYLALIATELGLDPEPWRRKAAASLSALFEQCFDADDAAFYDRDVSDALVRVQSDVLLRVFACEAGDADLFAEALQRYLMNTRKFLGHYGFTSLAMDDPRFDHDYTRNSWGGPSNALSMLRAPDAFERHGRVAELAVTAMPVLAALADADRFPQCLDPWSGAAGFASAYTPAILWMLDAVERYFGILPRPDGEVWFSGLIPTRLGRGTAAEATAASRTLDGVRFELAGDDERVVVHRDGIRYLSFPRGWRVVADRDGTPRSVVGLAPTVSSGDLVLGERTLSLAVAPNERVAISDGVAGEPSGPGFVGPHA